MKMVLEVMLLVVLVVFLFVFISMESGKEESLMSSYECGFDPSMKSRMPFSYRFFLISILFLVFDVEVSLMLPVPYLIGGVVEIYGVNVFLLVLMGGLFYEYYWGTLVWVK